MADGQKITSAAEIEGVIDTVRRDFVAKLDVYLDQLKAILETGLHESGLDQAIFISHRIAGVAEIFGYPDLGRLARITEGELTDYPAVGPAPDGHAAAMRRILVLAEEVASVSLDYHRNSRRSGA